MFHWNYFTHMDNERTLIIVGILISVLCLIWRGFSLRAVFRKRELHLETERRGQKARKP
jgi:hypothetical protein